jgi:dTDP-4-amino-4,6-dideoxygalactose transaminase
VPLLIDSAAGFGATDDLGARLGRQGDAEAFSFHATKPFAIGEGGLVTTQDPDLATRIGQLANFGFGEGRIVHGAVGLNAKLDEWHAAAGLAALDTVDDVLAARRQHAETMRVRLEPLGFAFQAGGDRGTCQFVPVVAPDEATRSAAVRLAREDNVELRTYFDPPLHTMPAFADAARCGTLAVTESLARRALSLPMANDLTPDDLERVVLVLEDARVGATS